MREFKDIKVAVAGTGYVGLALPFFSRSTIMLRLWT